MLVGIELRRLEPDDTEGLGGVGIEPRRGILTGAREDEDGVTVRLSSPAVDGGGASECRLAKQLLTSVGSRFDGGGFFWKVRLGTRTTNLRCVDGDLSSALSSLLDVESPGAAGADAAFVCPLPAWWVFLPQCIGGSGTEYVFVSMRGNDEYVTWGMSSQCGSKRTVLIVDVMKSVDDGGDEDSTQFSKWAGEN
jgi:hypothetical protein